MSGVFLYSAWARAWARHCLVAGLVSAAGGEQRLAQDDFPGNEVSKPFSTCLMRVWTPHPESPLPGFQGTPPSFLTPFFMSCLSWVSSKVCSTLHLVNYFQTLGAEERHTCRYLTSVSSQNLTLTQGIQGHTGAKE